MGFLDLPGLQYFYNKYIKGLKSHAFRDPANNLTTTASGYALDARQGKALKDQLDAQNSALEFQNGFSGASTPSYASITGNFYYYNSKLTVLNGYLTISAGKYNAGQRILTLPTEPNGLQYAVGITPNGRIIIFKIEDLSGSAAITFNSDQDLDFDTYVFVNTVYANA